MSARIIKGTAKDVEVTVQFSTFGKEWKNHPTKGVMEGSFIRVKPIDVGSALIHGAIKGDDKLVFAPKGSKAYEMDSVYKHVSRDVLANEQANRLAARDAKAKLDSRVEHVPGTVFVENMKNLQGSNNFEERTEMKKLTGAKFDGEKKVWYAAPGTPGAQNPKLFDKYLDKALVQEAPAKSQAIDAPKQARGRTGRSA